MTSIQERLQIKREPLDKWSVREQLCLASAVAKSGDQNWMSVSRALKPFGEPNRPADWFHQKNCASQYGSLLENVDTPKRKKRVSGSETVIETPIETILRKLTKDRIIELEKCLLEERTEYLKLQEEMNLLQSGSFSEELLEKWCKEIDEEERQKEEESLSHAQWLQEREIRKQEIERAWRPLGKPSLSLAQKRKVPEKLDTLDIDSEDVVQPQETGKPALSPLLTSLLKSPSQVQGSSILHTVITSQRHPSTSSTSSNTTIANLLSTSPSVNQNCDFPPVATNHDQSSYILSSGSITRDLLEDAVDSLPNIKVEDLESSILSSDDPLPEMKNEEVEVIISDLIQNADVVSNPEQHLQLDENEDIITNLDNELQELCNEEEAAAAKEAALAKNHMDKNDTVTPKRDPFEFEEDPEICQLTKHTSISKLYQENDKQEEVEDTVDFEARAKEEEPKHDKGIAQNSGSVEIVEVVVLDEEEIDKQLNKTQIQDIVHSFASEVDKSSNKIVEECNEMPLEEKVEKINSNPVYEDSLLEIDSKSSDTDSKTTVDEISKVQPEENFNDNEFASSFFDDLNMEVNKLDKSGKAKRDYSRTKKRENEKDFDILLAVEKAVNAQLEHSNDLHEENSSEKRDFQEGEKKLDGVIKSKIKGDTDGSCSSWNDDEELMGIRSKRRYSTPATPSDSVPNSPASSSAYFEDDRDYKNWKKSVMLVYSRLTTHKYASLFLKPITDEQAPGYHTVVYRPMDLQTIRKNIENGTIRTTLEFQRDVLLMFTNAIMYNKTSEHVYEMTKQMQQEGMQQIQILLQAQMGEIPPRRETRTSEPSNKRKRPPEENSRNKKRKED